MTANSFTPVSLDPPLVLFCLAGHAPSRGAFEDKFAGVGVTDGPGGVPLIDGVIARFICRNRDQHDAGDHVIFIGEVEQYERFEGEPLVFHSGYYRVATQHPEIAD